MKKIIITGLLTIVCCFVVLLLPAQIISPQIVKDTVINTKRCAGNIIADGGFDQLSVNPGGTDISTSSFPWKINTSSPQRATNGCSNSNMLLMWGNQTTGESVVQNGLTIQQNKKYRITVTAHFVNPTPLVNFVRLKIIAFNGSGTTSYNSNVNIVGITPNISGNNCITMSLPDWIAPANFNSIQLHPENDFVQNDGNYVSWIQVDDICMVEIPSCSCGKWEGFEYNILSNKTRENTGNTKPLMLPCGKTLVVKAGSTLKINPAFSCSGSGCKAGYKGLLTLTDNKTMSVNTFPYSFNQVKPGLYTITVSSYCNGSQCGSCAIKIYVTPGCEGDILGTKTYPDYLTAYEMALPSNINTRAFLNLDVTADEGVFNNLPNGNYEIQYSENSISLVNRNSNFVSEKFPFININPGLSCEEQKKEQLDVFNRDIAPGLQNRANLTCSNVTYCLGITCNGSPSTFYMLIFKPANRNCRYTYGNAQILKGLSFSRLIPE